MSKSGIDRDRTQLSPREAEVLALREQGLTRAQIAAQLGIRMGTVNACLHSAKIRMKAAEGEVTQ